MKYFTKSVILLLCLSISLAVFSQGPNPKLRGTLLASAADKTTVYLKSDVTMNNVSFTSATICVSIPDQSPSANPTLTVTNVHGTNLAWTTEFNVNAQTIGHVAPRINGGRAYYTFIAGDANANLISFGTSAFPIVEFTFNRTGIPDAQVQINDLSSGGYGNGGGPGTNAFFFLDITGTIGFGDARNTDVSQMFFGSAGTVINAGGASPSSGQLQQTIAPSILKEFAITKLGVTNVFLTWTTSQEQNVSHFILERSANGNSGWSKITQVKAVGNSNVPVKYDFTDRNVYDGTSTSKIVFYRLRSVDLDGQEKIFPVRSLRFSATGGKEISIYPNPVKDGFTISIPIVNPRNSMIRLNLVNHLGQQIHGREISAASASNYFYDIKTPGIINGEYLLQVIYDGELLDTKKVIVQR